MGRLDTDARYVVLANVFHHPQICRDQSRASDVSGAKAPIISSTLWVTGRMTGYEHPAASYSRSRARHSFGVPARATTTIGSSARQDPSSSAASPRQSTGRDPSWLLGSPADLSRRNRLAKAVDGGGLAFTAVGC